MKINTISKRFKKNETITIFTYGGEVTGFISEIADNHIVLNTGFKIVALFEEGILGWSEYEVKEIQASNYNYSTIIENKEEELQNLGKEEITSVNPEVIPYDNITLGTKIHENENTLDNDIEDNSEFIEFDPEDIPWKETGIPSEELFKGRDGLIEKLVKHYKSYERQKTYVLYGLTRTGKSSVLRFLGKRLENETFRLESKIYKFIPFNWDLSEAANAVNAEDLWNILLNDFTVGKIVKLINDGVVPASLDFKEVRDNKYRAKHLKDIIVHLKKQGYFPIFLIDEFTYIASIKENRNIDVAAFLASLRKLAFDNLACFLYAGAYNLKSIVENPTYGLTGQLVNTIEEPVGPIEKEAAVDLLDVFAGKVDFTEGAVDKILSLSNRIPYFIQIICKNAAFYSLFIKENIIDEDEIELVTKILVGDSERIEGCLVEKIPAGVFQNNQYMPSDPKSNHCLISSIAFMNRDKEDGIEIEFSEIQRKWGGVNIPQFSIRLNEAIEDLKAKGIIGESRKNGYNAYKIKVDLFRRWWFNEHPDLEYELSALKN